MKLNNKGITLLEMLIALILMSIISTTIGSIFMGANRTIARLNAAIAACNVCTNTIVQQNQVVPDLIVAHNLPDDHEHGTCDGRPGHGYGDSNHVHTH